MALNCQALASVVGVLLGEVWSDLMENIRLGNSHLSYRAEGISWSHQRLGMFVGGVVLLWHLAAFHHRWRPASLGVPSTSSR